MTFSNKPSVTGMTKAKFIEELKLRGWVKDSGVFWKRKQGRSLRYIQVLTAKITIGKNSRRIDTIPMEKSELNKLFCEPIVAAAPKPKVKRKPNAAFMAPMQPDSILGAVVGEKAMPRTEITKKLWDYIKKNGLQDATNRRQINADDKLKAVFGKSKVTMFEMNALIQGHLSKKG